MNQGIAQEEMVTAVPKVVMDIDQAEVQAFIQAVRAFDRREMVTGQEAVQAEAHIVPQAVETPTAQEEVVTTIDQEAVGATHTVLAGVIPTGQVPAGVIPTDQVEAATTMVPATGTGLLPPTDIVQAVMDIVRALMATDKEAGAKEIATTNHLTDIQVIQEQEQTLILTVTAIKVKNPYVNKCQNLEAFRK